MAEFSSIVCYFWIIAMFQTCPRGVKMQLSTLVVIMELLTLSKRMPEHVQDINDTSIQLSSGNLPEFCSFGGSSELQNLAKWMGFSQLQV